MRDLDELPTKDEISILGQMGQRHEEALSVKSIRPGFFGSGIAAFSKWWTERTNSWRPHAPNSVNLGPVITTMWSGKAHGPDVKPYSAIKLAMATCPPNFAELLKIA